jgi:UDP-N-acetylglucosamine--N-acetylmuramyl-(pentapeptide) pyrophosphoryl-undecaprenol N-acetylglucosamine transferase
LLLFHAESFERQGYASVLYEEDVNVKSLIKYVEELNQNNEKVLYFSLF